MLISRVWLESLLMPGRQPLPDDGGLSAMITALGLEVEGVTRYGTGLESIVVGEVKAKRPHPKADKLNLVDVFDGTNTQQVVCGASNVPEPGGRIAFAPEGAELPGGFTIGARTIRGIESRGMICSETELEIGADGDGIMVLPSDWSPGARLVELVPGIVDTVFELSVTPNRPDALGHIGVARDLAAKLGCTLAIPAMAEQKNPSDDAELVTLHAPQRCGRYFGYAFEAAKVGESPLWLKVRLHRVGLRPINNVVDITNFVLMEWGQPLHAFDRAKLAQGRVVVRQASEGETMKALDGSELTLTDDDLVIADAECPQALAGVMGGADSGVTEGSETLLLEAAWFSPSPVRRTARRHQISSDSSYRFERGVDHGEGLARALARASALIAELTGARLVAGHHARGTTPPIPSIVLRPPRIERVLGMAIPHDDARRILEALQVSVQPRSDGAWDCEPPTHRPDLAIEEDLIEEVMRHYGLDAMPSLATMPTGYTAAAATALRDPAGSQSRGDVDDLVDALVATGCHELVGFAFADPEALAATDPDRTGLVHVTNPMRIQHAVLRTQLLPGMLDALALNVARHGRAVRLFEVGRTYAWADPPQGDAPTASVDRRLPSERLMAGVLLSGGIVVAGGSDAGYDARSVGGVLLDALRRLGHAAQLSPVTADATLSCLHPGVQAAIEIAGVQVATFGAVHPDLVQRWGLPDGVGAFYGEIDVAALPKRRPTLLTALPRFPATARDLSLDAAVDLRAATIVDALRRAAHADTTTPAEAASEDPPVLSTGDRTASDVEVLEDYRGKGVAEGRRALLVRMHYRAAQRSVEDTEVQRLHDEIVARALTELTGHDAEIRRR